MFLTLYILNYLTNTVCFHQYIYKSHQTMYLKIKKADSEESAFYISLNRSNEVIVEIRCFQQQQ